MKVTTLDRMPPHALARIAELEAELKWLQNQHVRVCSSESKIRDAAQVVVRHNRMNQIHDDPATDNLEALVKALEGNTDGTN